MSSRLLIDNAYIIYLDESGTHKEARYFVVAGLSVFERETYFLAQSLDQLQARYFPTETGTIPFHASYLRAPQNRLAAPYDSLTGEQGRNLIGDIYGDIYQVIADSKSRIFAVAMEKAALTDDPYEEDSTESLQGLTRMRGGYMVLFT